MPETEPLYREDWTPTTAANPTHPLPAMVLHMLRDNPAHPAYIRHDIREILDAWGRGERGLPGHFLSAVLANDLSGAMSAADPYNLLTLPAIVAYVRNELPSPCHGSREKVEQWWRANAQHHAQTQEAHV